MSTTATKNAMRGLTQFITDIRACTNKDEEEKRVNKEMAKIRKKFKEAKEVTGYDTRKYVAKIIYMFMLGYDMDFGYVEAVNLLSANKYQEKLIGYLALTILLHENHEMLPLIIQSLQNDLNSRNDNHQCLALSAIANIGGREMSESLSPIIQKLLLSKASRNIVRKKAALCLLRLYKKYPEVVQVETFADKLVANMDDNDFGSLTALMSLVLGIATENTKYFESYIPKAIGILTKIVLNREYPKEYVYYMIPNPWLQVKLLRFLSLFNSIEDNTQRSRLYDVLKKILGSSEVTKGQKINHKNVLHAVLFEAIALVIHYDDDRDLIKTATSLLGRFISDKDSANTRYLALERMAQIAGLDTDTSALVKRYHDTISHALVDPDISIRKRAVDLLYTMCDKSNAKVIVAELVHYLATCDYSLKEEVVLKVAILAEKYADDYSWYVDVILQLIALAGDFVTDDIWFRVVQIVSNHEDIQQYAAKTVFEALTQPNAHETTVKVAAYLLGEFGHLIADNPKSPGRAQFAAVAAKFGTCSPVTKSLLLTTFVKFVNLYPEVVDSVRPIFQTYMTNMDPEIQQRACEYMQISKLGVDSLQRLLDVMPPWNLDSLLQKKNDRTARIADDDDESVTSPKGTKGGSSGSVNATPKMSGNNNTTTTTPNTATLLPTTTTTPTPAPAPVVAQPKFNPLAELESIFSTPIPATSTTNTSVPYGQQPGGGFGGMMMMGTPSPLPPPATATFTPAPVVPNTNTTNNNNGLLEIFGSAPAPVNPPVAPVVTPTPSPFDTLGMNVNVNGGSSESANATLNADVLKRLVLSSEGVLYQDDKLQIGFKSEYNKGLGRIALFFGNMGVEPITNFTSTLTSTPNLNMNAQAPPSNIDPKTQVQQIVTMTNISAAMPLHTYPSLAIAFVCGGKPISINVRLPVALFKFVEPTSLNAPTFFTQWKQYENPALTQQAIINVPEVDLAKINKLLSTGMRLAVLPGVDPNTNNVVAAGTFHLTGNSSPVLLRLETNPVAKMFRVTVRTPLPDLTAVLKDLLVFYLS